MFNILRPLIFSLNPEFAHRAAVNALALGAVPAQPHYNPPELKVNIWNKTFGNPIGLAAGFDKHGECYPALFDQGLGCVEIGGVTPLSQPGNPKPRLFRLTEDEAVINRMGLNSQGIEFCARQLEKNGKQPGIVGINIAPNKDSNDWVSDYLTSFKRVKGLVDYISVNISSPNTPGLRSMQSDDNLYELLIALINERNQGLSTHNNKTLPILIKIAPDLSSEELEHIAQTCLNTKVDGVIISNTTLERPNLKSHFGHEKGGLSGKPLFALSTQTLKQFYQLTQGTIPLIGVGGISSSEEAYTKIKSGATLLQLYSALVFKGFGLVTQIKRDLVGLLEKDGFKDISEAVGADCR
ncbi:MAG: quinone-dependent dihydroorotate dehydrogenase [Alphaproteobacteria bacterium]|nr:quinone-dependent dihydroorotate dehydrogenase [Alphaproteobacteria bacterium]